MTITAFATAVGGPVGAGVVVGGRILWNFMPDKIKRTIQKKQRK